jgi:hypothetical protein
MADLWSDAIEEARASAPADTIELETIEILHAGIVDAEDNPDSIRGVLDDREWLLQLEDDAPLRGGETVLFSPLALRVDLPSQEADASTGARLAFDNVPRTFMPVLDEAVKIRATAELIVRTWVAVRDPETGIYSVSGPPDEKLAGLTIREIDMSGTTITATARFIDLLNRGFPSRTFSREDFPALFGGNPDADL